MEEGWWKLEQFLKVGSFKDVLKNFEGKVEFRKFLVKSWRIIGEVRGNSMYIIEEFEENIKNILLKFKTQ